MKMQFTPDIIIELDDISAASREKIERSGEASYVINIILKNGRLIQADIPEEGQVKDLWKAMGGE